MQSIIGRIVTLCIMHFRHFLFFMENGVLKRYEPKAIIGRGGNGIVWSCIDKITTQTVAVKMIPIKRISRWKYSKQYEFGKIPYEVYVLELLIDCKHCIKLLGYYEGKVISHLLRSMFILFSIFHLHISHFIHPEICLTF